MFEESPEGQHIIVGSFVALILVLALILGRVAIDAGSAARRPGQQVSSSSALSPLGCASARQQCSCLCTLLALRQITLMLLLVTALLAQRHIVLVLWLLLATAQLSS